MRVKRYISILLAFLILGSNVGFAFNVHYCGGEIASVSLGSAISMQQEKGCCEKKAVSKKDSCCKDKKIVVKEKADDKIIKSFSFQLDSPFLIPEYQFTAFSALPSFKSNVQLSYYCDANAPPLYKLYSQYLLYDRL